MSNYNLKMDNPRPYFAEIPYYLWGDTNYDSEGDCAHPTDQQWTWINLRNREYEAQVLIAQECDRWTVKGTEPDVSRAAHFLKRRCDALPLVRDPSQNIDDWDHEAAENWAHKVRQVFERVELEPFDNQLFWGSWKRIGWQATQFTWVGRWIMYSVLNHDIRAVPLIMDWLRQGTIDQRQSNALIYALKRLTGEELESDKEWLEWYEVKGQGSYPEPDYNRWLEDLKLHFSGS